MLHTWERSKDLRRLKEYKLHSEKTQVPQGIWSEFIEFCLITTSGVYDGWYKCRITSNVLPAFPLHIPTVVSPAKREASISNMLFERKKKHIKPTFPLCHPSREGLVILISVPWYFLCSTHQDRWQLAVYSGNLHFKWLALPAMLSAALGLWRLLIINNTICWKPLTALNGAANVPMAFRGDL